VRRVLFALALVTASASARAANPVDACMEAADGAQSLRDEGKLIEAREKILVCAASSCPTVVAKQCAKWLQEVDEQLPTVIPRVRDAAGKDLSDAEVRIDGAVRAGALDGRAIPLNPGPHKLTFHREGSADAEESLVIRAGDKNRVVDVQLKAPTTTGPQPPGDGSEPHRGFRFPWTTGVFLGVGVASFVTMGALIAVASGDASTLRTSCAPRCATSDVDAVQTKITVANVMMGVGIASVAVSALFLVLANTGSAPKEKAAVSFGMGPLPGGAALGAAGSF
jgi:hypothetical protein